MGRQKREVLMEVVVVLLLVVVVVEASALELRFLC